MEYFLIDTSKDTYYPRPEGTRLINSPASSRKPLVWLRGAWRAVNMTNADDLLLCYLDIQAVLCHWISRLTFRRRRIVAINILLKDKPTAKNRIVSQLYKSALSSPDFHATVTSPEYGDWLNNKFNRQFTYYHLPDLYVYDNIYTSFDNSTPEIPTIFCGGHNGRDWNKMIAIAREMPGTKFKFILPTSAWESIHTRFPANVTAMHDIPYDKFISEMASSSLVSLPLDTEAPAGLIVMFQAAALGKPVVTSDTVTTRAYISPDMADAALVESADPADWATVINDMLAKKTSPDSTSPRLIDRLKKDCNRHVYTRHLENLIALYKQ